jgi:hypothetical protein
LKLGFRSPKNAWSRGAGVADSAAPWRPPPTNHFTQSFDRNHMDFFNALWLGMPVWIWLAFIGVVLLILAFDLGIMNREAHEIGVQESLRMSALYIGLGRCRVLDLPHVLGHQLHRPADRRRRHGR